MPNTTQVLTQENLLAQFPKEIIKINGHPTPEQVFDLQTNVRANASAIPSHLGGGTLGHLGLVTKPETYARASNTPFHILPNPGHRAMFPANATANVRQTAKDNYEADLQLYLTTMAVDTALKNYIMKCVNDKYIRPLRQANTQYGNCTALDLLTHIVDTYGPADAQELTANVQQLHKAWNISTSFEELIDQIETAVDFAELGGQPFTDAQVINSAYTNVFNTGAYLQPLHDWDLKQGADKTWANFKTHMLVAQRQRNKEQAITTGRQGYANQAFETSLLDLETALEIDRAHSHATANAASQINQQLQEALRQIEILKKQHLAMHDKRASTNGHQDANKRHKNNRQGPSKGRNTWDDYCWTHGFLVAPGHNSGTCNRPQDGHQKNATKDDTMGGSTRGIINRKPLDK